MHFNSVGHCLCHGIICTRTFSNHRIGCIGRNGTGHCTDRRGIFLETLHCSRSHIRCIGYSPMQEVYIHTSDDKVRIDYMEKSIAGYTSIFLKLMDVPVEKFRL